jgi:hypothetical protein
MIRPALQNRRYRMLDTAGAVMRYKGTPLTKCQSDGGKSNRCNTIQLPMKNESVRQSSEV